MRARSSVDWRTSLVANPAKFKLGDEVRDLEFGWRGRINEVVVSHSNSYHVSFQPPINIEACRVERQLEPASAVDRLAEIADD